MGAPAPPGNRIAWRLLLAVGALGIAAAVVTWQPWHGPILFTVLPDHGVDAGDLIVLPFVVVAAWGFGSARRLASGSAEGHVDTVPRVAVAAGAVGAVLLLICLVRLTDLDDRLGPVNAGFALLLIVTTGWVLIELEALVVSSGASWILEIAVATALVVGGVAVDLLVVPSGTVFGVAILAGVSAAALRRRFARLAAALAVLAVVLVLMSVASLTDIAGIDIVMAKDEGGAARTGALGLVGLAVGVGVIWSDRSA
jgi:hypothetical protein